MDPHQDVVSIRIESLTPSVSQFHISGRVTLEGQVHPTGHSSRVASILIISLRHNPPFYTPNIPLLMSQSRKISQP